MIWRAMRTGGGSSAAGRFLRIRGEHPYRGGSLSDIELEMRISEPVESALSYTGDFVEYPGYYNPKYPEYYEPMTFATENIWADVQIHGNLWLSPPFRGYFSRTYESLLHPPEVPKEVEYSPLDRIWQIYSRFIDIADIPVDKYRYDMGRLTTRGDYIYDAAVTLLAWYFEHGKFSVTDGYVYIRLVGAENGKRILGVELWLRDPEKFPSSAEEIKDPSTYKTMKIVQKGFIPPVQAPLMTYYGFGDLGLAAYGRPDNRFFRMPLDGSYRVISTSEQYIPSSNMMGWPLRSSAGASKNTIDANVIQRAESSVLQYRVPTFATFLR